MHAGYGYSLWLRGSHKAWARVLWVSEALGRMRVRLGLRVLAGREAIWHAGKVSPQVVVVWNVSKLQSLQVVGDGLQPICAITMGLYALNAAVESDMND